MRFDPFENRLCRDIRNSLASGFIKSIQTKNKAAFEAAIEPYLADMAHDGIKKYVNYRLACLEKVLEQTVTRNSDSDDNFFIAKNLWDLGLFFEFHELLEIKWLDADRDKKKGFQTLILAAVAFEQFEYGRKAPARKVAAKAVLLFEEHKDTIPSAFDAESLITDLKNL
jgi:hypothetical protein